MNSLVFMDKWVYWLLNSLGLFFQLFCCLLIFYKTTFSKNSFRNRIRVKNSVDHDQGRHFVGPDLGPNFFLAFLSSADFFKNQLFRKKNLSGIIRFELQTVWILIRPTFCQARSGSKLQKLSAEDTRR